MRQSTRTLRFLPGLMILPWLFACNAEQAPAPEPVVQTAAWRSTNDGVVVAIDRDGFNTLRLQVIDDAIVRVTATPGDDFSNLPDTLMVVARPAGGGFTTESTEDSLILKTETLRAEVELASGAVRFTDAAGRELLAETQRSLAPVDADPGEVDEDSFAVRQRFQPRPGEAIYGLGQQQDGRVDYAGENIELTTHNIEISIPFLVSSAGYGLLWNNTSVTRLGDPAPAQPLTAGFDLIDANGEPGGLTARYYDGETLLLERSEADLDYQFLDHASVREHPLPPEAEDAENLRIEWAGTIVPRRDGRHEFKMYSSGYARLSLDGETLLDRWRMNWNPWFHNASVELEKGRAYRLALDWTMQGGYFRLLHYGPGPKDERGLSLASETGKAVDYYVVAGATADDAIAGYRRLTGKATLLPKWAFGFWQSRERYTSQDELLANLEAYRERKIPIDNIVLDWSYWPVDAWGSHEFDPEFFPDPGAMVDRVHELGARIMISVWPKFYPSTEHYAELNSNGCMFNKNIEEKNYDWIGEGYLNAFYDAFGDSCRSVYWQQIADSLNVLGFDAWWLDAVEPDMHSNLSWRHRKDLMTPNALGTGAEYFNAYALPHAETVYRGERAIDSEQRSFILTRSGFGGIQRTGSAVWSGDIVTRWSNLREQIAAGIGVGLAGMPYWTFDIGGFTPEDHFRYNDGKAVGHFSEMAPEYQADWQEINLRWFQFGAFTPLFRSHGQNPYREIFNLADEGSAVYDSFVWYTRLRYRLMPYIYTLAGDAYHRDGTMMRGLVMDFPQDPQVRDIATEYLFGPAFLVAPVYEPGVDSRAVYLPGGADWYDFNSGQRLAGGQTIDAAAPLSRMPLFVRAGSIVPSGPAIQHTFEGTDAPLTLNVYTGADGSFEIYEDDGASYAYESGEWARIPVRWDDAAGRLTLGDREGRFPGMSAARDIHVRWITGPGTPPGDFDAEPDTSVVYTGVSLTVEREP
ncbi:MAG: glycoside hydrolase family 31 protein [Xanthomonadales bacterium]